MDSEGFRHFGSNTDLLHAKTTLWQASLIARGE